MFSTKIILRNFETFRNLKFKHKNLLNELTSKRDPKGSVLGMFFEPKYTEPPNLVYLAGGMPSPSVFPFQKASFKLKNGKSLFIDEETMSKALQYGSVQGYEPLICQLQDVVKKYRGIRDWEKNDLVITLGGTDALYQSLEMFFEENTLVLAENPLFGSVTQCIEVFGCKYAGIPRDNFGMKPLALKEEVLKILKTTKGNKKMVLYFNFMSVKREEYHLLLQRLKEIYEIAQEFNMFIVEVDPHFLLHLRKDEKSIASLLGLDSNERVLHCNTVSPLFGPGWRVGFVTGPKLLIELISSHIDMSMLSASMLSQVLISEILRFLTEEELSEYSKLLYENLRKEQKDLKSAAQQFLSALDWNTYPEYPFLSFKIENPDKFLSIIQSKRSIFFSQSLSTSTQKGSYLGISLLGTTAEEKEKICCEISETIREMKSNYKKSLY